MIAPRWKKALADIVVRPGRSALAAGAMAIGAAAIGALAFKQAILRPVLSDMHGKTRPASATYFVDGADDSLVEAIRAIPGVGDAELRPVILARLRVGSGESEVWVPAVLYVVPDFGAQRLNLFRPDAGAWPPADGEVLLERSAVTVAKAATGDALRLRIPGGEDQALRFSGTVHAAGLAPAWMEHVVYGFVPWNSVARAGARESSQILMRVAEHDLEEGHIREVATRVRAEIESHGRTVRRLEIPTPGRHPHAAQMETFLYLLATFAILAFLMSAVLAANMIHTLQSEQVREVGMMKAVGATSGQIAGIYLFQIGVLALVAALAGVPIGWAAGTAYARFAAGILNADVSGAPFPWGTLMVVVAVAMIVPLLTALVPVVRAAHVSVRDALADDGAALGASRGGRAPVTSRGVPRTLLPAWRATFARRGRLALTVAMMAVGGGMFMAALNVSAAWEQAVRNDFARRRYDLMVVFAAAQPVARVESVLAAVAGVARFEFGQSASPYLIGPDGAAGQAVALLGLDPTSRLQDPRLTSGRWLDPRSPRGVVINQAVLALHPALGVGDTVRLRYEGRTLAFPIAGIAREMLPQAIVYAPLAAMLEATGRDGAQSRSVRIVTREHGEVAERAAARRVERALEDAGLEVERTIRMDDQKGAVLDHLVIIQTVLAMAAVVVVLVGAVGLATTLTINVLQRTREFGVMSAIGATPLRLAVLVWCEGVVIALLSWPAALAIGAPAGYGLGVVAGRMFFKTPLDFTMSWSGAALWLGLALGIASLCSFVPARRAARLTAREAIAHV